VRALQRFGGDALISEIDIWRAAGLIPESGIDADEKSLFGVGNFQVGQIEHGAMHLISIETWDQTMFRFIVDRGTASRIVEEWAQLLGTGGGN
jgi:hypothetical protein